MGGLGCAPSVCTGQRAAIAALPASALIELDRSYPWSVLEYGVATPETAPKSATDILLYMYMYVYWTLCVCVCVCVCVCECVCVCVCVCVYVCMCTK